MLLLPGLAVAGDDVPSPEGEAPAEEGEPDAAPPPADAVPAPDGGKKPPAASKGPAAAPVDASVPAPSGAAKTTDPTATPPSPPPDAVVPAPSGATGQPADGPLPPAEGDVPGPHGEAFPAEPGAAPVPAAASDDVDDEDDEDDDDDEPVSPLARPTDTLYEEGQTLFARLEFDAAAGLFEEVLRREPEHPGARNYLVESLRALGRTDDADAVLGGANPPGEPTPVAEEDTPCCRNPRAERRFSAGIGLGGPNVGVGAWAEFRPHWLVGVGGGLGALVLVEGQRASGVGSVHLGADLLPLPLAITPVFGVGMAAVFGDAIWRVDALIKPLAAGTDFRLVPYLNLGARADFGRLQLQAGVWLVPTGDRQLPLLPIPGARVGLHF